MFILEKNIFLYILHACYLSQNKHGKNLFNTKIYKMSQNGFKPILHRTIAIYIRYNQIMSLFLWFYYPILDNIKVKTPL